MSTHKKTPRRRRPARLEWLEPKRLLAVVTYQGGPLIDHAAVETIYLGKAWASDPALELDANRLDQFFSAVTNSSYLDMLSEYGTPQGGQIGRGSFTGRLNLPQDSWTASVITDSTIQSLLKSEISAGVIAPPDGNQLLFIFTPPNVAVYKSGEASNGRPVGFGGYHDSFVDAAGQTVYYAVIPNPAGNDRVPGLSANDQQTMAASHEMAEAITDPTLNSWWDDSGDETTGLEIADFANPSTDTVYLGPYAVERVWSNRLHGLETPAGATLAPSGTAPNTPAGGKTQSAPPIPPTLGQVASQFTQVLGYDAALVSADYDQYLGRSPDTDGLNYWIDQMQAGVSANAIAAAFLASGEAVSHDGGTSAGWIDGLYHDLLHRAPDAGGEQFWLGLLQAGASKDAVALDVARSFEHESLVIVNDYQSLLGRAATSAEIDSWVAQLASGASDAPLTASLIGSPDYFNGPTKGRGIDAAWVSSVYHDLFGMSAPVGEAGWWVSQLQAES
jgi:hypothetical protein